MSDQPNPESLLLRHLLIHGRVQGVGYRWSLGAQARQLQLTGWVRNRHSGCVEALIYGTSQAVEALTAWAHQGPPEALVEHINISDTWAVEPHEMPAGFELRPTC